MSEDDPKTEAPSQPYIGPERRKGERRKSQQDRREMFRFEPEKDPRRSGKDRRKANQDIWKQREI
ncbi:hypothetical protein [Ectothiorhodospira sp. BSL-9]|uniref:hypothetical protein n=1 Tax=Ectothiorhodospira sp. BSL-9 TaxID=1442136 RepID=UPI0007B43DFA|nr:hypothetical protein [Ectothiorhodospira sp. BSL-9]ANB03260.1 hypothetical protein ECTOBSL9_2873 [Ectothiorhodospira sp. BSL-9]